MTRKKAETADLRRMLWDDFGDWSEGEREALWRRHGTDALAKSPAGKRPPLWWRYQSPEPRDRSVTECKQLFDMGALSAAEIEGLMPSWEHAYKMATRRGHTHCLGPGKFLQGRAAREATLAWGGVPQKFIDKWDGKRVLDFPEN
jgi:alkanesulfonate monooxygenase SsuD/methylene tetrahydromethanopterin reductase-like flavin-dependent oxidoreductase (luciferase family)